MVIFKILIKKYRNKLKISQRELALRVGTSRSYISEIENNLKTPSISMVEKIGNALGINPSKLISYDIKYKKTNKSKSKSALK